MENVQYQSNGKRLRKPSIRSIISSTFAIVNESKRIALDQIERKFINTVQKFNNSESHSKLTRSTRGKSKAIISEAALEMGQN